MAEATELSRGIAAVVSTRLTEAKITPRALEALTGIPATTLRRRLSGKTPFDISELEDVARVLGVNLTDITAAAEAAA